MVSGQPSATTIPKPGHAPGFFTPAKGQQWRGFAGDAKFDDCRQAPHVRCQFLVTDAKQPAVAFYEKMGFTLLDTNDNRERENTVMFIDLLKC